MHNMEGQSCAYVRAAPSAPLKVFCKVDHKARFLGYALMFGATKHSVELLLILSLSDFGI